MIVKDRNGNGRGRDLRNRGQDDALFVNHASGKSVELHCGIVVRTGPDSMGIQLDGDFAPSVRVRNDNVAGDQPLQVDDAAIVVGPLDCRRDGHYGRYAWPDESSVDSAGQRGTGEVCWIAPPGTWGKIRSDRTDEELFVHITDFPDDHLEIGDRVSFCVCSNEKGLQALDVQWEDAHSFAA